MAARERGLQQIGGAVGDHGIAELGLLVDRDAAEAQQVVGAEVAAAQRQRGVGRPQAGACIDHRQVRHRVQRRQVAGPQQSAKHGEAAILVIEIGAVVRQAPEPLAGGAVGAGAQLRHGDRAPQVGAAGAVFVDDCGKGGYSGQGRALSRGHHVETAPLQHEAGHGAVDEGVVVAVGGEIGLQVGAGLGRSLALLVVEQHLQAAAADGVLSVAAQLDGRQGEGGHPAGAEGIVEEAAQLINPIGALPCHRCALQGPGGDRVDEVVDADGEGLLEAPSLPVGDADPHPQLHLRLAVEHLGRFQLAIAQLEAAVVLRSLAGHQGIGETLLRQRAAIGADR